MTLLARGEGRPAIPLAARSEEGSAWIRDYVGLPWRAFGRERDGVDCWGLLCLVYRERFGVALPLYEGRSIAARDAAARAAERGEIAALMEAGMACWRLVMPGAERAGDGVLLRHGRAPSHVGIVIEPGLMLHIEEGIDAMIESYRGLMWSRRVIGIYRHDDLL